MSAPLSLYLSLFTYLFDFLLKHFGFKFSLNPVPFPSTMCVALCVLVDCKLLWLMLSEYLLELSGSVDY